jgi:hypothetical protein
VRFNGCKIRLWSTGKLRDGSNLARFPRTLADVGIAILRLNTSRNLTKKNAEFGIDLGLKEDMTLSTASRLRILECSPRTRPPSPLPSAWVRSGACMRHAKITNCRKDFLHKQRRSLTPSA